ncbi:unnamed protein product [Closterium sp. NIES-54]
MGAGDRAASKKYRQRQGGGGEKKELDKCLVLGCNRKHSWKECWSRPDGWKPQGYPGEAPPVTRPEWVERRMKNGAWNKKGSKEKAAAAAANEDKKVKEDSSDDGFSFLSLEKETALAGRVLADLNQLILDSWATCGMVPWRDLFTTYHSLPPNSRNVIVGSGDTLQAIGIGTITVKGKEGEVLNVKGCTVRKGGAVVMEAKLEKGLYLVPVCVPHMEKAHGVEAEDAACSTRWRDVEQVTADLLHLCMGHAGRQQIVECVKKGELKGVEIKEGGGQPSKCPDCMTRKLPRISFPTSTTRASAPLELVHTDVCGPMQTPDREKGSKYFITFFDDFSCLSWVTLVKTKDEVAKVFKRWIRYAEREAGAKVKIFRSDRAERLNRTLIDLARAMLAHVQLDHTWWQQLLQQPLSNSPRSPVKRVTWREKLQSLEQAEALPLRRTTRISRPPERFTPSAQYACMHDHEVHDLEECMLVDADGGAHGLDFCLMGQVHEPKSVKEALSRPEWVESMRKELESHKVNESFEMVDPACVPPGMEVLRCQWVWKYKHKADGSIERPKSRLVAMENTQIRGVYYDQVFTPVGKPTTLRGSLGMAVSSRFHIHHMDVTTAYLHGVLKEELYMRQPPGFDDGSDRVCRLIKSIYGLKQAPRQWYFKFDEALMDFGFERSECDPALYHLVRDEGRLSLYLYVDDILLMSSSMVLLDEVKSLLSSRFCMKDLGEAKYYLGVQIEHDEGGILIHQERYILNMLESFGLFEANPVRTPLPTGFDVHAHAEEPLLRDELVQLYQSIVGSLMYASTTIQPQIAYAVSQLSKVVSCPKAFHLQAAKRVLRYLKGCVKSGIFYPAHSKPQVELVGFSDADYAGDSADGKSHTGYVYCLNGAAISGQSKRQLVVALSTTESEYISLCQCIQEGVWLKRLFGELGHEFDGRVPVFVDNQSAIAPAQNACLHGRTKHMQVRWHFVREMVASGEMILQWYPTNRQAANILTKPLPFERHGVCMSLMGMQPHVGMVLEHNVGGLVLLCLNDIMLWMAPLPGQGEWSEGFCPVVFSHLQHEQGGVLIV